MAPGRDDSGQTSSSGSATSGETAASDGGSTGDSVDDSVGGPGSDESTTGPLTPPPLQPQKYTAFNYPTDLGGGDYGDDDAVIASALSLIDHACLPSCDDDVQIRLALG